MRLQLCSIIQRWLCIACTRYDSRPALPAWKTMCWDLRMLVMLVSASSRLFWRCSQAFALVTQTGTSSFWRFRGGGKQIWNWSSRAGVECEGESTMDFVGSFMIVKGSQLSSSSSAGWLLLLAMSLSSDMSERYPQKGAHHICAFTGVKSSE